jgi:hypothetical protein
MPTPVPPEVLTAARAAAEDSLVRFAAGDTSVTDEEALAYRNLIPRSQALGCPQPGIPVRKTQAGPVDLEGIREAVDSSTLALIEQAIEAKDAARFAAAYRLSLEGCYSCHKASEKPNLRPQIPTQPEVHIINFDSTARWPQ